MGFQEKDIFGINVPVKRTRPSDPEKDKELDEEYGEGPVTNTPPVASNLPRMICVTKRASDPTLQRLCGLGGKDAGVVPPTGGEAKKQDLKVTSGTSA